MPLVLGFAGLLAMVLLLDSAISGASFREILTGKSGEVLRSNQAAHDTLATGAATSAAATATDAVTSTVSRLASTNSLSSAPPVNAGGRAGFTPGSNFHVAGQVPEIAHRIDQLGKALGKAFTGISGYRTPAHSVQVGGYADDPHTKGDAVDVDMATGICKVPAALLSEFGLISGEQLGWGASECNHIQLKGGS